MKESTQADRTDSFDRKIELLKAAWAKGDYRLVRALAHSVRSTAMEEAQEHESPGTPLLPAANDRETASLPTPWREWARGWSHYKAFAVDETIGRKHPVQPIEIGISVPSSRVTSLAREIRLARVEGGALHEIPCQVHAEVRRGKEHFCKVMFLTGSPAHTRTHYVIFYGNPDAELPDHPTDLATAGEGLSLDIENDFYRARLSRQMGQLERLTFKRRHGLELFAGGEGHGEPPGIDWAHDYVSSGNFQKLRITLWERCPDYEVTRGPLCTIVRRWGFPYSPVHPVFSPSRIHFDVEYRFFAGLPWFIKTGRVDVLQDVEVDALRDDEWVFSGQSFTDILWMGPDGKLRTGKPNPEYKDDLWAIGFMNKDSRDAFIALYLEHRGENLPPLKHNANPMFFYEWHGPVWSRYPLPVKQVPAGAVLHQRNAYVAAHYTEQDGQEMIETLRHCLVNPLAASAADLPGGAAASPGKLARPGEAGDSPIPKKALWAALGECKDEQLYKADISVVDLGLVYDIRVRNDTVYVKMTMPHRGRPLLGYFTYGSGGNSAPVRQRLMKVPGVRKVVVEQTWDPAWSSNQLTLAGRAKLGMPDLG
ncbi:MAG: metal-sulfur cluster assembly factor [Bryobacteraceae bacterium]